MIVLCRFFIYIKHGSIILTVCLSLFIGVHIGYSNQRIESLTVSYNAAETNLKRIKSELNQLRQENTVLIEGRIPGLARLRYDEKIIVDRAYVKDIFFYQIADYFEFKLRAVNDTYNPIWPSVKIVLFNRLGFQIGEGVIVEDQYTLGVSESRFYSGQIALNIAQEPVYFLVVIGGDT